MKTWARRATRAVHRIAHESRRPSLDDYYAVNSNLLPRTTADNFIQLHVDAQTKSFLRNCTTNRTLLRIIFAKILMLFFAFTDAISIAGVNYMHVLSTEQTETLLKTAEQRINGQQSSNLNASRDVNPVCSRNNTTTDTRKNHGHLLDIGAGQGFVTSNLSPLFETTTCTEVSRRCVDALKRRGFNTVLTFDPTSETVPCPDGIKDLRRRRDSRYREADEGGGGGGFDVVALLNVLDRCDAPLTMLKRCKELMKDHATTNTKNTSTPLLLIALVLPFRSSVEYNPTRRPSQPLPTLENSRGGFERSVQRFVEVLEENGLEVVVWSRVPYLSMSMDWLEEWAVLSDVVVVCRKIDKN